LGRVLRQVRTSQTAFGTAPRRPWVGRLRVILRVILGVIGRVVIHGA
jgi:hypothetical protein